MVATGKSQDATHNQHVIEANGEYEGKQTGMQKHAKTPAKDKIRTRDAKHEQNTTGAKKEGKGKQREAKGDNG